MSHNEFPSIKFGICQVCNGQGADYANPGTGNVPATDIVGNGVVLEWYDGKLVCPLCKKELIADQESIVSSDKHAEEERFRGQVGFLSRVPD